MNVAGKTTTIKMLTESAAVKEMIAVSPQETAGASKLTVREAVSAIAVFAFLRQMKKQ